MAAAVSAESKPPDGLGSSGRGLWESVLGEYELEEHEKALLHAVCRSVDDLEALGDIVASEGRLIGDPLRVHPAQVEARQLRITCARLIAALRLPGGVENTSPQRRSGVLQPYQLRSVK